MKGKSTDHYTKEDCKKIGRNISLQILCSSIFLILSPERPLDIRHYDRAYGLTLYFSNHFKGLCYELFALIIPARPRVDLPCSEWPPGPSPLACQKCPSIHKTLQFPVDLLRSHAERNLRWLELIRLN